MNISGVKLLLAMLEDNRIEPKNYISFIKNIVKKTNIDEENNIVKTSKRGRKKSQIISIEP